MSAQGMECVVHGALAALLRVMRVVGMIPVRLVPLSDAFVVRYSFAQDVIARLLYCCFCLLLMTLELLNFIPQILSMNKSVQKRVMLLSTIAASFIRMTVTFVSILKGYQRTKQLCKNLNEIQKLNIEGVHDVAVANVEKRRYKLFVILVTTLPLINITDIIMNWDSTALNVSSEYFIRVLLYQFVIFTISMLEGQFVFTILSVHTTLQALNRRLGKLLTDLKKNRDGITEISSSHRILRQLATSYSSLCDVMRTLDKENGLMILMTSILQLLKATQSVFLLVVYWNINMPMPYTDMELKQLTFNRTMQCCRFLIVLINIMFLLEPCQWTYNEMEVTRLFVTRMTHYAPTTSGPLVNELEMFYRVVFTNMPSYSPLQLFTLRRSFILELSGALTTWLLIVLRDKTIKQEDTNTIRTGFNITLNH
nr:gustatory receptor 13.1 [Papilio memnon]